MMKILVFIGFLAFCANAIVALQLLGNSKCSWGPSYWCQNITNAAGCRAVKHCIQTVWEHQRVEQDTDSVCDICLKMVKQARDQLESNETQEEIKEVFEGSCKLIPIKAISSECCKLADDFIPELIDTLASQMNPQMVCSVAGLCNSERIDMLLENQVRTVPKRADTTDTPQLDTCQGCYRVVGILENKFDKMSKDQVLQSFLQLCGHLGSFSDSCSNIIVTYFTEIYQHLQNNFNPREVCLMAGECSAQFHTHSNVEITPLSNVGFVKLPEEDDLPCDLCKQLVNHLRDLLIANTTEDEFQRILIGLCKQTGSFQNECVSIATEYYPVIYKYLVEKLNSTATCSMIGICPNTYNIFDSKVQLAPLLTDEAAGKAKKIMSEEKDEVSGNSNVKVIGSPELMQLPIERIVPPYMNHLYNKQTCLFCEYFLHYVQVAITSPATEEKIKEVVEQACQKLPVVVNGTCIEFVDTYGDAFVAILAQEIDPSTICPLIKVCPAGDKNVEIFMEASGSENSQCPLCLFAVTKIEELVKDKKTEESIKNALQTLCNHLSGQVKAECLDFVNTYSKELVELLIADLTPQEVCVYLKLCDDKSPAPKLPIVPEAHLLPVRVSTLTNRIGDNTANGKPIQVSNKPNCVLCEFIMSKLDEMLENKKTEDEIKTVVHSVCNYLPKTVSSQCNDFVDKYADVVIVLLTEALKPSEICAELKFCDPPKTDEENLNSPQCLLCKQIMKLIEKQIPVNVTKADIEKVVREVCLIFPKSERSQCDDFMDKYGDTISDLILDLTSPGEICEIMLLCTERLQSVRYDFKRCTSCQLAVEAMRDILANPRTGHGRKHVLEKACRALSSKYTNACNDLSRRHGVYLFNLVQKSPADANVCVDANICSGGAYVRMQRETVLGANKCTWGPGYWCESVENAEECGAGAKSHCQKKVWNGPAPKK